LRKILTFLTLIADDLLLLIGVVFLTYGVFKIYIPAGYITLGLLLIGLAFFIAQKRVRGGDR